MPVHFVHRHVHDTVVMLEEGNLPLPRCPQWDLRVSRKALNGRHLGTSQCRTGTERKRIRLAEAEIRENSERAFHAYGKQMKAVTEFRYLGRLLTATYDDWPEVAGNIRKARVSWGRLARVLGQEGADPNVSRIFYTAVTQQVLLFRGCRPVSRLATLPWKASRADSISPVKTHDSAPKRRTCCVTAV